MSKIYKIAVLPGDGTGPEVVAEGLKVLDAAAGKFGFATETTDFDWGGDRERIERQTNCSASDWRPGSVWAKCRHVF